MFLCNYCGASNAPKACGACLFAHYCDEECQRAHWLLHKLSCGPQNVDISEICVAAWSATFNRTITRDVKEDLNILPKPGQLRIQVEADDPNFNPCSRHYGYGFFHNNLYWFRNVVRDAHFVQRYKGSTDLTLGLDEGWLYQAPSRPEVLPDNFRVFTMGAPPTRTEFFAWWASRQCDALDEILLQMTIKLEMHDMNIMWNGMRISPIGYARNTAINMQNVKTVTADPSTIDLSTVATLEQFRSSHSFVPLFRVHNTGELINVAVDFIAPGFVSAARNVLYIRGRPMRQLGWPAMIIPHNQGKFVFNPFHEHAHPVITAEELQTYFHLTI